MIIIRSTEVCTKRKYNDICTSDQRIYIIFEFPGIGLKCFQSYLPYILMPPGVTCKKPSLCFHGICDFLGALSFFRQAEIRMCIQPFNLIGIQIIRTCLIALVCTIS